MNDAEAIFIVQYEYSKEWLTENQKHSITTVGRIFKAVNIICGAVLMICAVLLFTASSKGYLGTMSLIGSILILLISLYLLFMNRINTYRSYKAARSLQSSDIWMLRFEFGDLITIYNGNQTMKLPYDKAGKLSEDNKMFYLFIEKGAAFRIPKNSFIKGSPSEFKSFIEPKLGSLINGRNYKAIIFSMVAFIIITIYAAFSFFPLIPMLF